MIETLVALLAAAVLLVHLTRRFGLGSILGYLLAGAAIGPSGLRLVTDVERIAQISELGVVMLLFLIGLELRPQRLWVMRRAIFGLGAGHLVAVGGALGGIAWWLGVSWQGAAILGAGFALSSTAIVLPILAERDLLRTVAGRDGFAVLLFQDLAFIPMIALVPLLADGEMPDRVPWLEAFQAVAAIGGILVAGRFVVPWIFRVIGGARTPELFTATALLIVVGTGAVAHAAGLSMSLGAFLAGALLSDSEFRHELQADIEPFEGLLLGFFFMSVGMGANLALALSEPAAILIGVVALLVVKVGLTFAVGRLAGQELRSGIRFAAALPQASEFSFVLFGAAVAAGVMPQDVADRATLVAALSMAATPLLFAGAERFLVARLKSEKPRAFDKIHDAGVPVIICGFGRVGQIVGRMLTMQGIAYTALDRDAGQVDVVRRFGGQVYYGDPTRPDILRAAGADQARILVVAIDEMEACVRVVEMARRNFPHLRILARARNRRHVHLLMDQGITDIVRETFFSSLRLTELTLERLGVASADARRAIEIFREHDERALRGTHAIYKDERKLVQSAQESAEELTRLFEADKADGEPGKTDEPATAA